VRILDVPELYRKRVLVTELAKDIGEVIAIDMNNNGSEEGDFVKARVWIDVRKCLTRFVSFKLEGGDQVIMKVKYEKIPLFCAICGFLGHEQEECGSGVHSPGRVSFGTWMLADTPWNRARIHGRGDSRQAAGVMHGARQEMPQGRGGGRGGRSGHGNRDTGRGAGRGQGGGAIFDSRKRSSTDASLTEVSPVKEATGGTTASEVLMLTWKEPGVIAEGGKGGTQKKLDFGGNEGEKLYAPREGTPPPPPSAREQKRSKKQPALKKNTTVTGSAASVEGRQSQ
jgi:hypothetical protein